MFSLAISETRGPRKGHQPMRECPIIYHMVGTQRMYGTFTAYHYKKMMYLHRYDMTFEEGIAFWKGPITCLMFAQLLKINVPPLHVS